MTTKLGLLWVTTLAFGSLLTAAGACSSANDNEEKRGEGESSDGPVLAGVNGVPPQAEHADGGLILGGEIITPVLPGEECAGSAFEGETLPLNMIVMMDRSVSMGDSQERYVIPETGGRKWDAAREGFVEFFGLPEANGVGVAIDFFGQNSCDVDDYSTPEVEVSELPEAADALLAAFDEWSPAESTPLGPALAGAIAYAREWKRDHAGQDIVVVQVTDGVPNGCGASPSPSDALRDGVDEIAQIAADGLDGVPSVPTFVLGIEGQEVSPDDFRYTCTTISQAGGSDPIIVEANDDLASEFSAALDEIRDKAAPPCSYRVPLPPADETLDLARVNVVLEPPDRNPEGILHVPTVDDCEHGGWYYDPPEDPESIELCPNTCRVVSRQVGAGFKVVFGCGTVTVPEIH